MKKYIGIIYAILASVSFGLMPIFAKYAYQYGSNPTTVLFYRFGIATLILFIYLKISRVNIKIKFKQFLMLFFTGLLGYTVTTQTLFMSYNHLSVGLATTLHFIYPAFVCIIGYIFLKEKMSKAKLISLIFAGIGVYSLVAFEDQKLSAFGIILALFSGVTYGITVVMLAVEQLKELDNRVVTMYVSFGATVGMFIYGIIGNSLILKFSLRLGVMYILISCVSTIIAIILLLNSIKVIGASSASILGTFEPIVSIILGAILFGEEVTLSLAIGGIFILTSTIILAKDKSGKETIEEVIGENLIEEKVLN